MGKSRKTGRGRRELWAQWDEFALIDEIHGFNSFFMGLFVFLIRLLWPNKPRLHGDKSYLFFRKNMIYGWSFVFI